MVVAVWVGFPLCALTKDHTGRVPTHERPLLEGSILSTHTGPPRLGGVFEPVDPYHPASDSGEGYLERCQGF